MSWVMERNRCGGRDAALVPKVMSGPKLSRRSMPISSDRDVSAPLADEKSRHLVVNKTDMYHEKTTHS